MIGEVVEASSIGGLDSRDTVEEHGLGLLADFMQLVQAEGESAGGAEKKAAVLLLAGDFHSEVEDCGLSAEAFAELASGGIEGLLGWMKSPGFESVAKSFRLSER